MALRCFEHPTNQAVRFAHTAPCWFDVPNAPLRPRKQEVEFLMRRVRDEITRSRGVLPASAITEYEQALAIYEGIDTDGEVKRLEPSGWREPSK